jgi:hypothetical protein
MAEHPCAGPASPAGPHRPNPPFCPTACPRCGATCQLPTVYHPVHYGYYSGHLHGWAD